MKLTVQRTAVIVIASLTMAGCSGLNITQPDYDNLPGSGDHMAPGPGYLDQDSKNYSDGGYVVYSNSPGQDALFNSAKGKASKEAAQKQQAQAAAANSAGYTPSASEKEQFRQFQEFQAFQHYKEFEDLPDNAKQRKKFEEWKQWDQYKKWKKQNEG